MTTLMVLAALFDCCSKGRPPSDFGRGFEKTAAVAAIDLLYTNTGTFSTVGAEHSQLVHSCGERHRIPGEIPARLVEKTGKPCYNVREYRAPGPDTGAWNGNRPRPGTAKGRKRRPDTKRSEHENKHKDRPAAAGDGTGPGGGAVHPQRPCRRRGQKDTDQHTAGQRTELSEHGDGQQRQPGGELLVGAGARGGGPAHPAAIGGDGVWRGHHQQGGQPGGEPGLSRAGGHQHRLLRHLHRRAHGHRHRGRGLSVQPGE